MTTGWLASHLKDPDLVVLCINSTPEFYAKGHIPGARQITGFQRLPVNALALNITVRPYRAVAFDIRAALVLVLAIIGVASPDTNWHRVHFTAECADGTRFQPPTLESATSHNPAGRRGDALCRRPARRARR